MTDIDYDALAREAGLDRVGARAPLGKYLAEVWQRRNFAYTLAKFRIQASLHESRLGMGWIVLQPLLMAALYGTIFGIILPSDTRPDNFLPFLVVGVFIFQFFSKCFSNGAKSITGNSGLVRSLSFPRMLMPLAQVIQQVLELIPMMLVLAVIVAVSGEPITWSWLLVIPVMALMALFNLGVALIAARLTVHLRDIGQIIPLINRLFFYGSGIFYSLDLVLVGDKAWLLPIAHLNPVGDYIALVRNFMVEGPDLPPIVPIVAVAAAFVTATIGIVFFWRAEERYGRD